MVGYLKPCELNYNPSKLIMGSTLFLEHSWNVTGFVSFYSTHICTNSCANTRKRSIIWCIVELSNFCFLSKFFFLSVELVEYTKACMKMLALCGNYYLLINLLKYCAIYVRKTLNNVSWSEDFLKLESCLLSSLPPFIVFQFSLFSQKIQ